MSKETIDLTPADPLTGTELVHVVQGGNSRKAAIAAIAAAVPPGPAGGNVMSVGLLKNLNGADVLGADLVRTSGNEGIGKGGGDYAKDNTVDLVACPKAGFTDKTGQKYRIVSEQPLNSQQFYDATDSSYGQCINRGLKYLHDQIGINGGLIDAYRGSVPFRVPAVRDDMTTNVPIDIYHNVEVFGDGSGEAPYPSTGCTHIHGVGVSAIFRIQHPTTFGDNDVDVAASHPGAGRAKLHGFMLTNDSPADITKHGIIHRGIADIWDIYGRALGGLVIRNWTGSFRGGTYGGNTSTSSYRTIKGEGCQGTWSIGGTDSNLIHTDLTQGYQNRQFGGEDANAAGANQHDNMHNTYNGLTATGPFVACSYLGNIYVPNLQIVDFTNPTATSTLLNAHAPSGTTAPNSWWVYAGVGGVSAATPAYASGGPWIYGGDMLCMTPNATTWNSCYNEGGGLPNQSFYVQPEWVGGTVDRTQLYGGTLRKSTTLGYELIRDAMYFILRGRGGAGLYVKDYDDVERYAVEPTFGGPTYVRTPSSHNYQVISAGVTVNVGNIDYFGLKLLAGKYIRDNADNQILSAQGAAVADAVHSAAAPTQAEFNAFVDQFNAWLARARLSTGHGLIAG